MVGISPDPAFDWNSFTDKKGETLLKTFSHPESGAGEDVRSALEQTVLSWHAQQVLGYALQEYKQHPISDLREVLARWLARPRSNWSRPIGRLWRAAILREKNSILPGLVEAGLWASFAGIKGNWAFKLENPIKIRLGQYLIVNILSGEIKCDGNRISGLLNTVSGQTQFFNVKLDGEQGVSHLSVDDEWFQLPHCEIVGAPEMLLVPGDVASPGFLPPYAKSELIGLSDINSCGIAFAEGIQHLADYAPTFFSWVTSVVQEVVPMNSKQGELASSSSPWDFGTVAITADSRASAVAEMLVHEASHQHFFIAKHLGKIDDGSDPNLYFSPMVGQERPIEKILLAFHALGNMVMLHASFIL